MPTSCRVDGCDKPVRNKMRQLCQAHYLRWWTYGSETGGGTQSGAARRFFDDLQTRDTKECIEWPFAQDGNGYGTVRINAKTYRVSRLALRMTREPPSPMHQAAHNCGNRLCVNPQHLRWATAVENMGDCVVHGTHNRGERCGNAKLRADQVRQIRALRGKVRGVELAKRFGISQTEICNIQFRRAWRHI